MYPNFKCIKTLADAWIEMDFFKILDDNIDTWYPSLSIPWNYSAETLDMFYFLNTSGRKPISPMLRVLLDLSETESLIDADRESLVKKVFDIFNLKWLKLWNTLEFQYDPIQNYDMEEILDKNITVNDDFTHGKVVTTGGDRTDNVFGFNDSSENGQPATKSFINNTDTNSGTDEKDMTEETDYTVTRKGNIGVTTSQQMIEAERGVWQWDFFKQIFKDVDSILTLAIY